MSLSWQLGKLIILLSVYVIAGQIPCDDAYGQYCPSESGWGVGDCLKKQTGLETACLDFIGISDTCKADIDKFCTGKEYTGDLLPCLIEWTKPAELSPSCAAALPKKEPKEKKMTAEEKAKASRRRSRRNNAAKIAREF